MKRLATLLCLAALSGLFIASALGGKGLTCSVSPNPALLHSDVTVMASGLPPGEVYWLWVSQPGNQIPGAHPAWGDNVDASGNWTATFNLDTVYGGPLQVGRVDLSVKPDLKGFPTARCSFDVA